MTTVTTEQTITTNNEDRIKQVLEDINEEYYQQDYHTKQELILRAAKRLEEETDIPKNLIASELVKHRAYLRFVTNKRIIYKALEQEYKRDYNIEEKEEEESNEIDNDAENVRKAHNITDADLPMTEDKYHDLKNKNLDLKEEVGFLKSELVHYKNLFDAGMNTAAIDKNKMCHEIVTYSDMYDQLREMMDKSPNGFLTIHDGFKAEKFKTYKFRKPIEGDEN